MKKKALLIIVIGFVFVFQPLSAQTWISSKRLTWNSGGSSEPDIASDSSDNIHVVWRDDTSGNEEICYKKSTNGGTTWTTKRLTYNSGDSDSPALSVDSSDNIHVVWRDDTSGNEEIYYKKSTNGGTTWITKRLTYSSGPSGSPALSVDSSDNIHVVWDDFTPGNREIYYKKSTNGGTTWSGTKRLTWNPESSQRPIITTDSSNNIHVVFEDVRSGNEDIYYSRSTDGGITWSGAKRLTWNSGWSWNQAIAIDSNDNIIIVWQDATPGQFEIYYKKSTDGGTAWSSSKRLTWNPQSSGFPTIAIDSDDYIHVVWEDYTPGNYEIYHKKSVNGGATWFKYKRLTWSYGLSTIPAIVIDSADRIHLIWADDTPGNSEIYYKKGIQ